MARQEVVEWRYPGRRQGKYGNNLFKYKIEEETLLYRSIQKDIEFAITFHYQKEELKQAVQMKHNTAGKAIAYEVRDYGDYFMIKAIIELPQKDCIKNTGYGTVGIDMNVDHLAVCESDDKGNIVNTKTYRFDVRNKTEKQRKAILQKTICQFACDFKERRKPVILEDLNFERTKGTMLYGKKIKNQVLSEFAYKKIRGYIESRMYKEGIEVIGVNPCMTTRIGDKKYKMKKGMSVHMSAAYVIARRGMGYIDRI